MKTFLWWLNYRPLLLALLGFAVTACLHSLGVKHDLSKSDWGTWVGAIGTMATLAGTLFLATTETRRRERSEMILARLHAAALAHRIHRAYETVLMVRIALEHSNEEGGVLPQEVLWAFETIANTRLWDIPELVPLAPLPGPIAPKLAQVIDQFAVAKEVLKEATIESPSDAMAFQREVLWASSQQNGEAVGEEANFHRLYASRLALKELRKAEISLREAAGICAAISSTAT